MCCCASCTQGLCTQRADDLVNDAILQGLLCVKVLVAVEVKLDLHIGNQALNPIDFLTVPSWPSNLTTLKEHTSKTLRCCPQGCFPRLLASYISC